VQKQNVQKARRLAAETPAANRWSSHGALSIQRIAVFAPQ